MHRYILQYMSMFHAIVIEALFFFGFGAKTDQKRQAAYPAARRF